MCSDDGSFEVDFHSPLSDVTKVLVLAAIVKIDRDWYGSWGAYGGGYA